jgi:hypothetical protein
MKTWKQIIEEMKPVNVENTGWRYKKKLTFRMEPVTFNGVKIHLEAVIFASRKELSELSHLYMSFEPGRGFFTLSYSHPKWFKYPETTSTGSTNYDDVRKVWCKVAQASFRLSPKVEVDLLAYTHGKLKNKDVDMDHRAGSKDCATAQIEIHDNDWWKAKSIGKQII